MTLDERVFVGVGANLGDARSSVLQAIGALSLLPGTQLVACSSLYRSAPVEAQGPNFINAVAELRTQLKPLELLHALHAIEHSHGRERPHPNAPRTLDLDLLLVGKRVIAHPLLTVPHPRLHQRAFVLLPLLEIDPGLQHPQHGRLDALAGAVASQTIERLS